MLSIYIILVNSRNMNKIHYPKIEKKKVHKNLHKFLYILRILILFFVVNYSLKIFFIIIILFFYIFHFSDPFVLCNYFLFLVRLCHYDYANILKYLFYIRDN